MKPVDYHTACELQDLGYDGEYIYFYRPNGQLDNLVDYLVLNEPLTEEHIPAPRLDDAAYFLRERYCINIRINYCQATEDWFSDILNIKTGEYYDEFGTPCTIYDSALAYAVTKAIEIIKNN